MPLSPGAISVLLWSHDDEAGLCPFTGWGLIAGGSAVFVSTSTPVGSSPRPTWWRRSVGIFGSLAMISIAASSASSSAWLGGILEGSHQSAGLRRDSGNPATQAGRKAPPEGQPLPGCPAAADAAVCPTGKVAYHASVGSGGVPAAPGLLLPPRLTTPRFRSRNRRFHPPAGP